MARKKAPEPVEREWCIDARIERDETVIVRATSPEEALRKFNQGDYESCGDAGESLNWKAMSDPTPND